jgi:hypothetical protein
MKMKTRKNSMLTMLLGLLLAVSAAGMAQTPAQGDQDKKAEACCSMESCCCNNGSCPMKAEGTTSADAKACGDSCDMKNHADHAGCCGGSCNMKDDAKKDGKHDCCKIKTKSKGKQKA